MKIPVHVSVERKSNCAKSRSVISELVVVFLSAVCPIFCNGPIAQDKYSSADVWQYVNSIIVEELEDRIVSFWQAELCVHVYCLSEQEPEKDFLSGEEEVSVAEQWELPNKYLVGLWESIVVEREIKRNLLGYCDTSLRFADAGVDSTIIAWNRLSLLHGPPGTGKTTLCKGLAQKVFIRNSDRFESGLLLEINSHSLFSKWFSESGKLVMKLFDHIAELADDDNCLVCVLIDEVESLVSSRENSLGGQEPGDAVRVVNAVLTSLDSLKRRKNVLVLCTSNLSTCIDPAFRDRVDMMVFLGPPPAAARFDIMKSCLVELMRRKIISPQEPIGDYVPAENRDMAKCQICDDTKLDCGVETDDDEMDGCPIQASGGGQKTFEMQEDVVGSPSDCCKSPERSKYTRQGRSIENLLSNLADKLDGWSGRSLRKLPLRAHACFLQRPQVRLKEFVDAMDATIKTMSGADQTNPRKASAI